MNCPKCDEGYLIQGDIDCRQEWHEEEYYCDNEECGEEFTLRTDYGIQSNRIVSQTLTDSEGVEYDF